jgi:predicted transcriptional regulator
MQTATVKESIHQLADQLSNDATWDGAIYEMTVRSEIEKGMADSNAGKVTPVKEVLKEFGFSS